MKNIQFRHDLNAQARSRLKVSSFFLIFCLSSCSPPQLTPSSSLQIYIGSQPDTTDWAQVRSRSGLGLIFNSMQGLFDQDLDNPQSAKVSLQLCQSFTHTQFTQWEFKLKEGILWSDGVPLIADHFVYGLTHILDKQSHSPHASRLFNIKNAQAFYAGQVERQKIGVKAIDKHTLSIELEKPDPDLPLLLSSFFTYPRRADFPDSWGLIPPAVIGPYHFMQNSSIGQLCMKLRENRKAFIQAACFRWLDSSTSAFNLFKKGDIDIVGNINPADIPKNLQTQTQFAPTNKGLWLFINPKKIPDIRLRQQIVRAVDSIENRLFENLGVPTSSLFPNASKPRLTKTTPSLQQFSQGTHKRKIQIGLIQSPNRQKIVERISSILKQRLSLDVHIQTDTPQVFSKKLKNSEYDLILMTWIPSVPTPSGALSIFRSMHPFNPVGSLPSFDKVFDTSSSIINLEKRQRAFITLEQKLIDELAVVAPVVRMNQALLLRSDLSYRLHPSEKLQLIRFQQKK